MYSLIKLGFHGLPGHKCWSQGLCWLLCLACTCEDLVRVENWVIWQHCLRCTTFYAMHMTLGKSLLCGRLPLYLAENVHIQARRDAGLERPQEINII